MSHLEYHNNMVQLNLMMYDSHRSLLERVLGGHLKMEPSDVANIVEKYVEPMKLKPMKDPNKPKGPKSAYFFFSDETRPQVQKKHPAWKFGPGSKEVGKLWRTMKDDKKKKYMEMAEQDKERAREELEKYQQDLF